MLLLSRFSAMSCPDASRELLDLNRDSFANLPDTYAFTIEPANLVVFRSETIAGDRVFRTMCWTNAFNYFTSVEVLGQLIDRDPENIRRILRVGRGRRKGGESYRLFLRCHGIIAGKFRHETHWCLLGVGAIQMTLSQTGHLNYVIGEQPLGSFL